MHADMSYSSLPMAKKRERLEALAKRINNGERTPRKKRDDTNIKNCVNKSTKRKRLNSHFYKKLFRIAGQKKKVLQDVNHITAKKSCSGSRRKKRRLCSAQESSETFHQSRTENKIESGSGELTENHDHVLYYVNKLRDYWNKGQNAVVFDGQDRLVKVVLFVSSLLDNMKNPVLIMASLSALSLWEIEFSKLSKSMNVVMYKGNKDTRAAIRDAVFYSENACIKFQALLSSPDAIVEDMEMLDHIKWELLVIDECQDPIFSTHFDKLKMLMADRKLVTVSGESEDISQSYRNILSLIDCNYDMEMHDNINTLKERLSPFIAFECKFDTRGFEEYWVPVHLSSMQIEQYCSILASILGALSSSSRNSLLHDILTQIQKCCDHPYLVDPDLRDSSKKDSSIDPLDAEINVSGKMQLFDKLLLEIKRCGLRALVLFQSAVNSEKISTAHILDDLINKRFGENSYIHIPKMVISNAVRAKKKELLEMFNHAESERFICLCDYQACHSSVRLSRLDVVILFNSEGNPLNDIKAFKKITIDSPCERLHVFRLYSAFTVEEKALILAKQGTAVNYITSSIYHKRLAWGASYLFSKLQSSTDSGSLSFIDDLVHELSSLLKNASVETGPTNRTLISNAQMQNGAYCGNILLFGETETHTKESCSIDKYLIDKTPSLFWSNLVKESQYRPEISCSGLSRRVSKSTRSWFEGENQNDASPSSVVRSKPRTKRKGRQKVGRKQAGTNTPSDAQLPVLPSTSITDSTSLNPSTNEGQQGQSDQPPHTSSSSPLEKEIEIIQKEREQITKSHQEKKSMLLSECEKEISEIRKKYDALIHDSEMSFTREIQILEDYQKLVNANKLLAEELAKDWHDNLNLDRSELILNRSDLRLKRKQKETSSFNIPDIPASALVRPKYPCLTGAPSPHSLAGSGLRAPAPHLRSNPSTFASLHSRPITLEPFLDPLPVFSTTQTLPCIQTESNNQLDQVYSDLYKLPSMDVDGFYGEGGPSLPFLDSNHGTY